MIDVEKAWQKVAEGLVKAEADYLDFQSVLACAGNLEKLPAHNQHILSLSSMRSNFVTMVERMMPYTRRNGGLEFLLLKETEVLTDSENESELENEEKETEDE